MIRTSNVTPEERFLSPAQQRAQAAAQRRTGSTSSTIYEDAEQMSGSRATNPISGSDPASEGRDVYGEYDDIFGDLDTDESTSASGDSSTRSTSSSDKTSTSLS